MTLKKLPYMLTVAKYDGIPKRLEGFYSLSVGEGEISLVAETTKLPEGYLAREDGWCAMMVVGPLDFSLVGILAELSSVLAEQGIPLFAISTYDTDYLLVKNDRFEAAVAALVEKGYEVEGSGNQ